MSCPSQLMNSMSTDSFTPSDRSSSVAGVMGVGGRVRVRVRVRVRDRVRVTVSLRVRVRVRVRARVRVRVVRCEL